MLKRNAQVPARVSAGRFSFFLGITVFALCFVVVHPVHAAIKSWSGAGANGTWTNAANWGGAIPTTGDDLVFPAGAARLSNTNTFVAGTVFNSITFSGTNYVVFGNSISLTGALGISAQNANGTNTFHPSLTLNASSTFECTGAGATLVITTNSGVNLNGRNLTNNATGTIVLSCAINGTGDVTKNRTGKLTLDGPLSNTYGGAMFVNAGTVEINKTGGTATAIPGDLFIGDGVSAAVVRNLAAAEIADTANVTVNQFATWDLNGKNETIAALTLSGGTVTTAAGTLTLGGDVTAVASSVEATITGRLDLGGATRTFNIVGGAPNPAAVISAIVTNGAVTKIGNGNMRFSGANTYTGLTVVSNSFLFVANPTALGTAASGTVLRGGHLLIEGVLVSGETLTNESNSSQIQTTGTTDWSSNIVLNAALKIQVFPGTFTNRGAISGSGTLTKEGAGTLVFAGPFANTYTNATFVNSGTLLLSKTVTDGGLRGPLFVGDGLGGPNADVVQVIGREQLSDTVTPVTVAASGLFDLNGINEWFGSLSGSGNVTLGAGNPRIGFDDSSTTFSGVISGAGGINKVHVGTLTLTGTNTYTGTTVAGGGVLLVQGVQPQSAVSIAGGTLGGTGVVGNISSSIGTLSPGSSFGVLTSSNVLLNSLITFNVELGGTAPGVNADQLNVRGTNNLNGAILNVIVSSNFAPATGQTFTILNNDDVEGIWGTFAGAPEGSVFTSGLHQFVISYVGGTGSNDVTLTYTNPPLSFLSSEVGAGNGNRVIDPNECNNLFLTVMNVSTSALAGVSATLSSLTPGVVVTQPRSPYPAIAPNSSATNLAPFQIITQPFFPCGAEIQLLLTVTTANGNFVVALALPSGSAAAPARFNNNTAVAIPDLGMVESTNIVSGITSPIKSVAVSLHLTHTFDDDVIITLIGPDGTEVELSSNNGGGGNNYGADCTDTNRTLFEDTAATSIVSGAPPFIGAFRPEEALGVFVGKSGAAANGVWRLRVEDDSSNDVGDLICWSLFVSPTTCAGGNGLCDLCPNSTLHGAIGAASPFQSDRLSRNGVPSACGQPGVCPGPIGHGSERYEAFTFRNGPTNACITVTLTAAADLFSAAYTGQFIPGNLCTNYLGDCGDSTVGVNFSPGPRSYSFNVASNANFVVTVNAVDGTSGPYQLSVTGGDCRPRLNLGRIPASKVRLDWPTSAGGYSLESTPSLPSTNWSSVSNAPVINGGRYAVTNSLAGTNLFYRLSKP